MDPCRLMFPSSYPEMKNCKSLLMIGGKDTYKSSLLLQIANSLSYQASSSDIINNDCAILFISKHKLTAMPLHVHNMPKLDADAAKTVSMQYFSTYADLINHLASLFLHTTKLQGLLIDGIDEFLKTIDEREDGNYKDCLAKLLALLVDLGGHYSNLEGQSDNSCSVVATFNSNDENDIIEQSLISSVGGHFFEKIAKIEPCVIMGMDKAYKMVDCSDTRIYYYIEDGEIFLHRIAQG